MKNKKAVELSINFLVIVIISLVMLSTGLLIVRQYFGTAEEIQRQLDEQTVEKIENLLDEGDVIAIPLKRKIVGAGEQEIFGMGVMNINEQQTTFDIEIMLSNAYDNAKNDIDPDADLSQHPESWLLYPDTLILDPREKGTVSINVNVPAGVVSGTYIFNARAEPYDRITKMYVIVP